MTALVAMTAEMVELADACKALDAARHMHEGAIADLHAAARELEDAKSRRLRAVEALERSCRASLPTLPGEP